jgi:uncharacterized protein YggU (UPF0235/DUF167 family)
VKFLAEVLGEPASNIEIVGGHTGRDKIVSILDTDTKTVHNKLLAKLT